MEIKRIILVTKFKGSSEQALRRALTLARENTAHLDILNVIDMPESNGGSVDEQVEALDQSLSELISHEKTMREIIEKSGNNKWTPEAHITLENPNATKERLLTLADKDFIVIGFGDWSDRLDLSAYLSHDSSAAPPACPIWLTPLKARKNLRKQLVFVADSLPGDNQYENFNRVCEMALKKHMSLDVLSTSMNVQAKWKKWLDKIGIEGYSMENYNSMDEVRESMEVRKPGVIAVLAQSSLTSEALSNMDSFIRADLVVI